MNTKILFFMVLLLLPSIASAKYDPTTRTRLMQKAGQEYQLGNYDAARKIYLDLYVEDGDKASQELMNKCTQCITLISDATMAEKGGQFIVAIEKYQAVMSLNPTDKNIPTLIAECKQRLYAPSLQFAKQCYREGKYGQAKEALNEYTASSGVAEDQLLNDINNGLSLYDNAQIAYNQGDYSTAKTLYENLLALNPTDVVSAQAIADINERTQKVITVPVDDKPVDAKKNSIIPEVNRFNFRISSGFNNLNKLGLYAGYNYKIFQIGVDFSFGKTCKLDNLEAVTDDITNYNTLLKDAKQIGEREDFEGKVTPSSGYFYGSQSKYFSSQFQFLISPGLNFKYFSIECGIGANVIKEYNCIVLDSCYSDYDELIHDLAKTYYYTTENSVTKLVFRPTVSGYIPVGKNHRGFSVSLGYNIVGGLSGANQIILGIGFFI